MDIMIHLLTAITAGTTIAAYKCSTVKQKIATLVVSFFAGILPDIDVISLWSGFDRTFGHWFSLADKGRDIYHATFWYSHHGFMHSLLAVVILSSLVFAISKYLFYSPKSLWIALAFGSGYTVHLLGDMVTPGGPWGGICLFFPFKSYVGGTGSVWWWNNYDIFICALIMAITSTLLMFVSTKVTRKILLPFVVCGFIVIAVIVCSQTHNYNNGTYSNNEKISIEIQKERLSPSLFNALTTFDSKIKVQF